MSVFADLVGAKRVVRALTIIDMAGLIVGFAVAAYIFRGTILAVHKSGAVGLTLIALVAFAWLGTVAAGPVVLAIRRFQHGRRVRFSAGESIWGVLGLMWVGVGVARSLRPLGPVAMTNAASLTASAAAGLAPLLLLLFWYLERSRSRRASSQARSHDAPVTPRRSWCHHVGIFCVAAWPAGWTLAAFLLGV